MECAASSNSILSQRSTTKKSPRVKEAYLTSLHWGGRSKARVTQIPRSGLVQFRLWKYFHSRKNWIHIGCQQAGPRVAAILSVIESCRRMKIPVRDYLGDILPGLANTSIQRLTKLTPTAWAANHQ